MKTSQSYDALFSALPKVLSLICVICALTSNISLANEKIPCHNLHLNNGIIIKTLSSSKAHKVKLYPNTGNDVLFFSVFGESGKLYQLFVFDMDGKLVRQAQVRNSEITVLNWFEKGNYLFEIFSNDDRIENGSIQIK